MEYDKVVQERRSIRKFMILENEEKDDHWLFPDILSIGAAMEHICLEAVNLQLGALWIGDVMYTEEEIRKSTRHEELQLVSGIAIGYPDENPNPRPRNEMSEIIVQ